MLNSLLLNSLFLMFEPSLSSKLASSFNFSQSMVEVYTNFYVVSIIGGSSLTLFILINLNKTSLITFGTFLSALGLFLIGPSRLFNLPDTPETVLAGLITCGFGRSVAVSLLLAEIIEESNRAFPELRDSAPEIASAFYVTALGLGSVLTPFLSRSLSKNVGFGVTMDILGMVVLIFAVTRSIVWRLESDESVRRIGQAVRRSQSIEEEQESLVAVVEVNPPSTNSI